MRYQEDFRGDKVRHAYKYGAIGNLSNNKQIRWQKLQK